MSAPTTAPTFWRRATWRCRFCGLDRVALLLTPSPESQCPRGLSARVCARLGARCRACGRHDRAILALRDEHWHALDGRCYAADGRACRRRASHWGAACTDAPPDSPCDCGSCLGAFPPAPLRRPRVREAAS